MSSEKSTTGISPSLLQAIASTLSLNKNKITVGNGVENTESNGNQKPVIYHSSGGQAFIIIPNYINKSNSKLDNTLKTENPLDENNKKPNPVENQSKSLKTIPLGINNSLITIPLGINNSLITIPLGINLSSFPLDIINKSVEVDNKNTSISSSKQSHSSTANLQSHLKCISSDPPPSTTNPLTNSSEDHPTSSSSSSSSTPAPLLCPICTDNVSGFHYGIYSCESCKGFFKRSVQNKKVYMCRQASNCPVDVLSRKKCPACRFEKCKLAGMKVEAIRPDRTRGGRSNYENHSYNSLLHSQRTTQQTSHKLKKPYRQPSQVFNSYSNGRVILPASHIDHLKANFNVKNKEKLLRKISETMSHKSTRQMFRNHASDMPKFQVTSNPQSDKYNSPTHPSTTPNLPSTTPNHPSTTPNHPSTTPNHPSTTQHDHPLTTLQQLWSIDSMLEKEGDQALDEPSCPVRFHDNQHISLDHILHLADHCLYRIVQWARSIPHFTSVSTDDQILLLQNSWCQLLFLNCCYKSANYPLHLYLGRHYNDSNNVKNNSIYSKKKTRKNNKNGAGDDGGNRFFLSRGQALKMGVAKVFSRLLSFAHDLCAFKVDHFEMSALKVIVLITPDITNLTNERQIADSQESLLEDLTRYSKYKYPENPNRIGHLITKLSELYKTCVVVKETLMSRDVHEKVPDHSLLFELLKGDEMLHS